MTAKQFYELSWDAMLMQDSANVSGYFEMCLLSPYKQSLKIGYDKFLSALARIIDNLVVTQQKSPQECAELLCRYHLAPTVLGGRDAYYYMGPKGSSSPGRSGPARAHMGHPTSGIARTGLHMPPNERVLELADSNAMNYISNAPEHDVYHVGFSYRRCGPNRQPMPWEQNISVNPFEEQMPTGLNH